MKQLQARKSVDLIRASKRINVSSFVLHAFSALTLLVERRGGGTVLKVGGQNVNFFVPTHLEPARSKRLIAGVGFLGRWQLAPSPSARGPGGAV